MDLNLHKIIKINWITISTNYTKTRICIASKTSSVVNFTWMILKICYLFHWSSVWIVVCHRSQTQYLEYWCQKDMHIYVILPPYHLLHWKIESLRGSVCISEHLRTVGFLGASSGPPRPLPQWRAPAGLVPHPWRFQRKSLLRSHMSVNEPWHKTIPPTIDCFMTSEGVFLQCRDTVLVYATLEQLIGSFVVKNPCGWNFFEFCIDFREFWFTHTI